MMNYSVILLGATISLSVFIRLCVVCGAIEINSDDVDTTRSKLSQHLSKLDAIPPESDVALSLSASALYQYEADYRKILQERYQEPGREAELDQLVEQRMAYLRTAPKTTKSFTTPKKFDENYYDEQICGIMSNTRRKDVGRDDELRENRLLPDGFAPFGCFYEDEWKKQLVCNDRNMREVPYRLPRDLERLHVSGTKIQQVNRTNFGDVSITNIQLVQNEITEMQPWAFSNVKNIGTLEVMDNYLSYLAFDIYFGLTDVFALHLDGNQISFKIYENCSVRTNISDIPLVLPELRVLMLRRNPLQIIPAQMWGGLRESKLTMLDMSSCALEFIHHESFKFLPRLQTLYLINNPRLMPTLASALEGLRNGVLENLALADNGLHRFPTEAISIVADTLLSLDLSGNPLAYLSTDDIPPNLIKIRTLNLANCYLMDIQDGTLDRMPSLLTLSLNYNFLKSVPKMANLTNLNYLTLSDNVIIQTPGDDNGGAQRRFVITENAFANLQSVRQILLTNTKVKEIPKNAFSGLRKIEMLVLDNTELKMIEDGTFTGLNTLRSLTLSNNRELTSITPLNSMTFYGLHNLKYLYMANCQIKFKNIPIDDTNGTTTMKPLEVTTVNNSKPSLIPDEFRPFKFLSTLQKLELSNNSITHMYPELFSNNMYLTQLLFDGNELESWNTPLLSTLYAKNRAAMNEDSLIDLSKSTKFALSVNKLSFITEAMISDLISFGAYVVDLSSNIFMCDKGACALRDLMSTPDGGGVFPYNVTWTNMESYRCLDPNSDVLISLVNVTNEMCAYFDKSLPSPEQETSGESSNNWTTIVIASTASFAGVIAIAAVAYKQRAQIRYLIFRAQLNISVPRKAKTSVAELIQYDYDIFISYHNEDRDFIQNKFLPEVEDPSFRLETKDHVNDLEIGSKSTGFRVCLHERDFEAGMPITENILEAVDRSKKVVIVVSKKYLESQWCTFEMNLAYHRLVESRRKSFVVIILEEIPSNLRTKVLNYLMRTKTYLEWPGVDGSPQDVQRFWTRLRSSFLVKE